MMRDVSSRRLVVLLAGAAFCIYVERQGFSIAYTRLAKAAAVDEAVKGRILAAFFCGYAVSQVPGGALAQRFGGRPLLLLAFVGWSCTVFLTPTDATRHAAVVAARVVVGLFQGCVIPSVHTVLSQSVPPTARAMATSMTTSGMYLGSATAMWVLPGVAEATGAGGLLTCVGILGLVWSALWYYKGRAASAAELELPTAVQKSGRGADGRAVPWRKILASPAVWSIVANNFSFHYAVYVVMTWLPTYFSELLKADLTSIGFIKGLPYVTMFLSSIGGGWLSDTLIYRAGMKVARGRKAVNTLGFLVSSWALVVMPSAASVGAGMAWTTLLMGALGVSRGGFSVNHMDIAPKYAGIVMGISNTAGTLSGVIGVALTGTILEANGGSMFVQGWSYAFGIAAFFCAAGAAFFVRSAKGERLLE